MAKYKQAGTDKQLWVSEKGALPHSRTLIKSGCKCDGFFFHLPMNAQLPMNATSSLASIWNLTPNLRRLKQAQRQQKHEVEGRDPERETFGFP